MKGPGFRHALDVRRHWRCPECGREEFRDGDVQQLRCGDHRHPDVFCELVKELGKTRSPFDHVAHEAKKRIAAVVGSDHMDESGHPTPSEPDQAPASEEKDSEPETVETAEVVPAAEPQTESNDDSAKSHLSSLAGDVTSENRPDEAAAPAEVELKESETGSSESVEAERESTIDPKQGPSEDETSNSEKRPPRKRRRRSNRKRKKKPAGESGQ
ncbi:hypothetical protein Pan189_09360 [Stratiformator vulcanicus]|uniref:Uncharacterized protein n=1 Tax=Stratiformator vulcanicus TaxID=2527980 RepID=A0A517QY30_9PLAN|nr:hypothetical protein Pan189_09360 [Stratiformator vulcanicus]